MGIINSKPIQKISWSKKVANNHKFFKDNGNYFIARSVFGDSGNSMRRNTRLKTLYEVYNSKFPSSWFKHIVDQFNTGREGTENTWPAKIRPMNILRPNIEFLRGQYPKRPFNYQVVIKGEDGYNSFLEAKKEVVYKNLSQIFINTLNDLAQDNPDVDTGVDSKPVDMPDEVVKKFTGTFKNILAVQAQTDLDLILADQKVREKLMDMIKDWLIAGETYSYKDVLRDEVIYERVSPLEIDFDQSPHVKYVKDSDWVVRRMMMNPSDVVDRFYDSLEPKEIDKLEDGSYAQSPAQFSTFLNDRVTDNNLVPVFHFTWRSFEKVGMLSYPNPITGKTENDIVNEDYPVNPELGETIEWYWRSRWLQGYRIGAEQDGIFAELGPVRYAPSMMNDLAKTTGPYNGRAFSNTHADNISVLKMGLPFQIMYIILNFTMERTVAKSRGKIILIDQNVIPKGEGWNEEKFFQFSEAQGWAVINRNQIGVDKSFNQYQSLDMNQFEHIDNLIGLMDFCKRQYDDQLGISRQAKAQINSSDTVGGNQQAIFQSSVITDMIFTEFEQFVLTDMEGLLDCSQISNINGKRASYISSDGRTEILRILPEEYCYSQMGIMMTDSTKENDALTRLKQYGQAFAQNGVPPSAIIEIETSSNIAQLKALLLNVEQKQQEIEQATAANEQEARMAEIQIQQQFAEYNTLLETQKMHEEYNRKEDLVLIQGDINMALTAVQEGAEADPGIAGTEALMKYSTESRKIEADNDRKNEKLAADVQAQKRKENQQSKMDAHKRKMDEKEFKLQTKIKEKEVAIKKIQANKKPAAKK